MDDLRPQALDLLACAPVALVTTIAGDGFPNSRAMFNLRNREQFPDIAARIGASGFTTYFTTNTSSPKVAEIAANPVVSAYYCLPGDWRGLMLGGRMEVVTAQAERAAIWMPGWTLYYPGGPDDPDHTVLVLRPTLIKYYHQLRHVRFDDEAA